MTKYNAQDLLLYLPWRSSRQSGMPTLECTRLLGMVYGDKNRHRDKARGLLQRLQKRKKVRPFHYPIRATAGSGSATPRCSILPGWQAPLSFVWSGRRGVNPRQPAWKAGH